MKAIPLFFLLAAAPLLGAEPPASPTASADCAHPTLSALAGLTDGECVAIQNYRRRATAAALRAYADAFGQALAAQDAKALRKLLMGADELMLRAEAAVPTDGLPEDFRAFIPELLARTPGEAALLPPPDALRQAYPRPAACISSRIAFINPDDALKGMANNIWTQRGTPEGFVAEIRERAAALAGEADAATARRELLRLALRDFDERQAARSGFPVGGTMTVCFPHDPRLGFRWQLAEPLPADAPIALEWRESVPASPSRSVRPARPDRATGPMPALPTGRAVAPQRTERTTASRPAPAAVGGRPVREAILTGLREGGQPLRFVFSRPGDDQPLYTCEMTIEVMPSVQPE